MGGEAKSGELSPTDALLAHPTSPRAQRRLIDTALCQRRMRIAVRAGVDDTASGRLWILTALGTLDEREKVGMYCFLKYGTGTYHVVLGLLERSPPTYVDVQAVIEVLSPLRVLLRLQI
ncbi:hypothetical protein BV22DRAFT_1132134 [Leucogyrophana mollusca]|uniref:Uncharacterized protein n=1 Tax=Leucogyrophana mollusca TaxID=85980 RepID=A0ACB8B7U1_9AGAM|nr:hypothetical protein BV22DRAFT_1132134 [Leucogyrophana mollusca]